MKNQNSKIKIQNHYGESLSGESVNLKKLFTHSPIHSPRRVARGDPFTKNKGFTLIEVIMIIVVVSIAIPTLLIVLGQGARQGVNAELEVSATNVAQALMEEIKTTRWDENATPPPYSDLTVVDLGEAAGDPTTYDDVDDYAGGVPDISVGGVNYTRSVQVCYVQPGDLNNTSPCVTTPPSSPSSPDYKRIQVTVSNATLGSVVLVTLVGNY